MKKDQEGDASAALSLYCKALEYFVPALHCESTLGGCVGAGGVGSTLGGGAMGAPHCSIALPHPDESDARRKEAIRAKVSQKCLGKVGRSIPLA